LLPRSRSPRRRSRAFGRSLPAGGPGGFAFACAITCTRTIAGATGAIATLIPPVLDFNSNFLFAGSPLPDHDGLSFLVGHGEAYPPEWVRAFHYPGFGYAGNAAGTGLGEIPVSWAGDAAPGPAGCLLAGLGLAPLAVLRKKRASARFLLGGAGPLCRAAGNERVDDRIKRYAARRRPLPLYVYPGWIRLPDV
jgi:hypothetical protein